MTRHVPTFGSFAPIRSIRSTAAIALLLAGLACFGTLPRESARADEPPPPAPFDVNADGVDDWGYTHPTLGHEPPQPGYVAVFSGADDTMLWFAVGEHGNDAFGGSSAVVADVDGDGAPDVLVAAPLRAQENPAFLGRAHLVSGATGEFLRAHEGEPGEWFALEVSATVDRDLDGVADYSVYGAAVDELERRVFRKTVYSGATGAPLYSLSILASEFEGGLTPGDVNGDGMVDAGDVAQVVGSIGETGDDLPEDVSQNEIVDSPDVSITLANVGSTSAAPLDADGEPWPDLETPIERWCTGAGVPPEGGQIVPTCPGGGANDDDHTGGGNNNGGQDPGDTSNGGGDADGWGGRPIGNGSGSGNHTDCDCPWILAELHVPTFVPAGAAGAVSLTHPNGCHMTGGDNGFTVEFTAGAELIASGDPLGFVAGPEAGEVSVRAEWICRRTTREHRIEHFTIAKFDLDIDSDNTNSFDAPERSGAEETLEDAAGDADHPGKIVLTNTGDVDDDGVPDWADGMDVHGNDGADASSAFTPIVLDASSIPTGTVVVRFAYAASLPSEIDQTSDEFGDPVYSAAAGDLRIWTQDGPVSRRAASVENGGDFVAPDVDYDLSDLTSTDTVVLFVELIGPSTAIADRRIEVHAFVDEEHLSTDAVRITALPRVLLAYNGISEVQLLGLRLKPLYTDGSDAEGELLAGELSSDRTTLFVGHDGPSPHATGDPARDADYFVISVEGSPGVWLPAALSPALLTADEDLDAFYSHPSGGAAALHDAEHDPDAWVDPNPGSLDPDGFEAQFEIFLSDKYDSADPSIEWLEREAFELRGLMYAGRSFEVLNARPAWRDGNRIFVEDSLSPEEAADAYYTYLLENYGPSTEHILTRWLRYYGEVYNETGSSRAEVGERMARHWGLVDQLTSDLETEVYTVGLGFFVGGVLDLRHAPHLRFTPESPNLAFLLSERNFVRGKWVESDSLGSLGRIKNHQSFSGVVDNVLVSSIPDGNFEYAVLEIKDVITLSRLRQIRAQGWVAWDELEKDYVLMVTNRTKEMTGPLLAYFKVTTTASDGITLRRTLLRRDVENDTYFEWVFDDPTIPPPLDPNDILDLHDPSLGLVGPLGGQWVPITKNEVQAILGQ